MYMPERYAVQALTQPYEPMRSDERLAQERGEGRDTFDGGMGSCPHGSLQRTHGVRHGSAGSVPYTNVIEQQVTFIDNQLRLRAQRSGPFNGPDRRRSRQRCLATRRYRRSCEGPPW